MIPFQERKKIRKILYSKITLVVLFLVLLGVGRGAWGIYQKAEIARSERDITARSLAELQDRTIELKTSLNRLKSSQGIEEEVRQKYTVARPGEEVVVVIDENAKKSNNSEVVAEKSLWERFISIFSGK